MGFNICLSMAKISNHFETAKEKGEKKLMDCFKRLQDYRITPLLGRPSLKSSIFIYIKKFIYINKYSINIQY